MIARQFNAAGLAAFRGYLAECRIEPARAVPQTLLVDPAFSDPTTSPVHVEPRQFRTRQVAAEYLHQVLSPISDHDLLANAGLWSWLSLYYFDQVCPIVMGIRQVTNDYSYVFEPKNPRHFYRHLLFIAWRVKNMAPEHCRLFLTPAVSTLDHVTTEVLKRLYLTRIPCIFEVLDRLYWDSSRGRARAGIVGTKVKAGDLVHRLPIRIRQLEVTYDLNSLSADQLVSLLGTEFQQA
ncbi:hypothetical protein ETAA8_39930 [Anatilimnocola aggregata]|uniref:Uncharacterized protein n=1 Tax=Anatilimnocola aggregata TaxID=2528021 RepID=A0A517YF77_9BACT|nr:hypothetical protein ETAA8_39930 [Anatilimnocola aggregata]